MPSPRPKSSKTDGIREVEEAIYLMCPPMAVATAIRAFATPAPGAFGSELFLNGCLETAQHDSVSRRELFLESPPLVLLDVIGIPEHLAGGRVRPVDEPHGGCIGLRVLTLVRHNQGNRTAAVVLWYMNWLATTGGLYLRCRPFY